MTDAVVEAFTRAGLKSRILILQGGGRQREEVMQLFRASATPYILVSPSAMLGLSLNDDLARWQVIVKVPYANIGDPSVSHRMNAIPGWYEWQTAKDLIQTFGRICRSMSDWGVTYVLDAGFQGFYKRNRNLFPPYVQSAIQLM
jgi:Rad3-related DNA helicase